MKRSIIQYVVKLQDQKNKYQSNISIFYIFHPGYTRLCLSDYSIFSETIEICPDGHNFCFKKFPKGITRLPWVIRGCAATCPKAEARVYVDCCARDKCNR
uniref:Uncharacterized protein n=1 Tax=Naja naja TaxID=35670 RepID=A0A8C6XF04_NAJNA